MSKLKNPNKVKLVTAIFSQYIDELNIIQKELTKKYGTIDFSSGDIDFTETTYYNKEMGDNLKIRFLSFQKRIDRSALPSIKLFCLKLEKKHSVVKEKIMKRKVNIDPGLLSLENFILSTGKPYSHRIYLDKGVWAEITLIFKKDHYAELDWTYPNYKSDKVKDILLKIRKIYHKQLNDEK